MTRCSAHLQTGCMLKLIYEEAIQNKRGTACEIGIIQVSTPEKRRQEQIVLWNREEQNELGRNCDLIVEFWILACVCCEVSVSKVIIVI